MKTELKPIAQVSFELRANILKGQWEADEINDTDFFRAMCGEYEDYIPALQSRITELEKLVKDWQEIAQFAGGIIEDFQHLLPIGRESDIERVLYDVSKAPKVEK